MREGLEGIRRALLEADVAYDVAGTFLDRVAEGAVGAKVLESLDPAQQLVGIVHRELIGLMGPVDHTIPLVAGRTTFAIAHRLSTLRNASRLVVLDKGEIAEIGTHEELMEKQGVFYNLVQTQTAINEIIGIAE
jgi:signal recognition particle GTPase